MAEKETKQTSVEMAVSPPKSDVKTLVVSTLVLTLLAAPMGWFLGYSLEGVDHLTPLNTAQSKAESQLEIITASHHVIVLPAITTDMSSLEGGRIRMEIALVSDAPEQLPPDFVAEIANDFIALLRQTRVSQIKGASGFMYLREDLLERAKIRSNNQISNILISTLVIEQE